MTTDAKEAGPARGDKVRLATAWLGGCSGCHMSFLDLDERLIDLQPRVDLVYSPIMDTKEYPEGVDVCLVEGAVANEDNLHLIRIIRARTKCVVSFGDCAVSGNVTAMRNPFGSPKAVLERAYLEGVTIGPQVPSERPVVPRLLEAVLPVHHVVKVDVFLPGCPPPAGLIHFVLVELLEGRTPDLSGKLKYG
jgi:NAD-reducing hydrogenase small subunit